MAHDLGCGQEFARLIRETRPLLRLVGGERPQALLSRGMGRVLGDLAASGYDAEWDCIPAQAVGAPHRRDRVFLVAYAPSARPFPGTQPRVHRGEANAGAWDEEPERLCGSRAQGAVANAECTGPQGRAAGWGDAGPTVRVERSRASMDNSRGRRYRPQEGQIRAGWDSPFDAGWWLTEPDVGRVAHGVPKRVDRLRCLGNSVVPQVAEHIGRMIVHCEKCSSHK